MPGTSSHSMPSERDALILKSCKVHTCVSSGFWHLSYCNFVVYQSSVKKKKVWPYLLWLETSIKNENRWVWANALQPTISILLERIGIISDRSLTIRFKIPISAYSKISKVTDGNQACLGRAWGAVMSAYPGSMQRKFSQHPTSSAYTRSWNHPFLLSLYCPTGNCS